MDDGGGGGGGGTTVETFVPVRYIFLAKRGRFKRLAQTFVSLLKLNDNGEQSLFDAGTKGAYYFRLESSFPDGIYLVAPDNSFDFDELEDITVTNALESMAAYSDDHAVQRWTELASALSDLSSTLSSAVSSVSSATICGLTIPQSEIPAWQSPGNRLSVLFRWLKQMVANAETYNSASPVQMTSYRVATNRIDIPCSMSATMNGEQITFSFDLYFLI